MRIGSIFSHAVQAVGRGALVALLIAGLATGTTLAGKPAAGGGGHGGSCTVKAPLVNVDNTWAWGQKGSFGLAAQQLTFAINVINYDVGCGSSTFTINVTAPGGFSVSVPTSSVSLKSSTSGYLWAYVTSPAATPDGDYPVTVTVQRSGTSTNTAATSTYYKVYSSDSVAPTLFWPSPGDGMAVNGGSFNFSVSSTDDHAVKSIELSIDGAYRSTTACDNISSTCQLSYTGSVASGPHTASFKSLDWLGNVGVLTTTFTAN
jgi:hypothetical protein